MNVIPCRGFNPFADPAASKSLFTRAAAAYEQLIPLSEGQLDRASLSYNAGAAHQLARG